MNREDILRRAAGVRALAERGDTEDERQAAAAMLDRLMAQYGLSETDLMDEQTEVHYFGYSDFAEERILYQVLYMVLGETKTYRKSRDGKRTRHKQIGVECTAAKRLEIELTYEFFLEAMKEELKIFFIAFASKNNMYPPPELAAKDAREIDGEEAERIKAMMKGMEAHTRHAMIEAASGE